MQIGTWDGDWTALNAQRNYPLAVDATKVDETGSITLPDSFLVGLSFPLAAGHGAGAGDVRLAAVTIYPTGYLIEIGLVGGGVIARAQLARAGHAEGDAYALAGVSGSGYEDSYGAVAVGDTADVDALPPGRYAFSAAAGRLDPDCTRTVIRGIAGVAVTDGVSTSERVYGDLELVAGSGIQLSLAVLSADQAQLRIDVVGAGALQEAAACDATQELPPPIRTINRVSPKANGDFTLIGVGCLEIEKIDHGLRLNDSCTTPCDDCTDLEALAAQVRHLDEQTGALSRFVSSVESATAQLQAVLATMLDSAGNCN